MQQDRRIRIPVDQLAFATGLALGTAVLVAFGFADLWRTSLGQSDFAGFWAGPRAVLDGVNPYDAAHFTDVVQKYGTQDTELIYGYPPWDLVLLLPFALLPVRAAAVIWTALGLAVAIYGLGALLRREVPGIPAVHFLAGLALIASQPAVVTLYSGQWGFFLTGMLALSLRWQRDGHRTRAGLAAVAMVTKPQLFVFAAWAMAATAFVRRQLAFAVSAGIGGSALVGLAWLAFPDWLSGFLTYVAPARTSDPPRSVTVATPLAEWLGPSGLWLTLPIIAVVLIVALRFQPSSDTWLAVWLAASVALTTYSWSYDHIVLVVPVVLAMGAAQARRRAVTIGLLGFGALLVEAILLYQVAVVRGSQSLNVLVPFTIFVVVVAGLWSQRKGSTANRWRHV